MTRVGPRVNVTIELGLDLELMLEKIWRKFSKFFCQKFSLSKIFRLDLHDHRYIGTYDHRYINLSLYEGAHQLAAGFDASMAITRGRGFELSVFVGW